MWTQNSKKRVKKTELWDVNSELQEKSKKKQNCEMWTQNCKKRVKKNRIVRCELRIARKE